MMKLADKLELPPEAVTQTFAMMGKRGGGKSYAATKLAELMLEAGAQIVCLDPVGVWYGLRVPKNEKSKAFDIPVFGGQHGDIELDAKAGKLIAELIVERSLSAVIDISMFISSEQSRFVYDFLTTFFEAKKRFPSPVHVFLEEAQEITPQNIVKGDSFGARMLHAGERMVKLGRNFGIGCTLISQRPQEVNKKVLNQTEVMLAFQMTGLQERETIARWVADKGSREELAELLPTLETGEAHVWSPSWLRFAGTVKISEKLTADVSATPTVGQISARKERRLAPVEVEELREIINALKEEKAADDPKLLKKQIAELKRELAEAKRKAPGVPEFPAEELAKFRKLVEEQRLEAAGEHEKFLAEIRKIGERFEETQKKRNEAILQAVGKLDFKPFQNFSLAIQQQSRRISPPSVSQKPVWASSTPLGGDLPRPQQKILDALALCEQLGLADPRRINVAFFAGYTENGHFNNSVGALNQAGLLHYPAGGHLALTDAGRELANAENNRLQTLDEFHRFWMSKLKMPEQKVLAVLLDVYPESLTRDELAARSGYTVNGHFNNTVGHLSTLGIAGYPAKGYVAATDVMFPEGLY